MSNFEKLSALGAEVVGGDLIFKHKVLGRFRSGDLILTEDGIKMLDVEDVVAKEDAPARPARTPRKKPEAPVAEAPAEPEIELDVE